ncbi:L,D-transpeptidase family protein [Paenibacillus piscarius]|uniref:L,D-transpeptidase family protein n=1 Tax=Paenibacillus piscarius TaxID=1089681 RepID=UPI001EE8540E
MKNSQHLKAYVQMHPDNKMAWYLLGKEYYKNGQFGKANYCFNQAGEVYEAFERSKVPAEMLREYENGLLESARERQQTGLRRRRVLLALMVLLLMLIPAAVAPGFGQGGTAGPATEEAAVQAGGEPQAAGEQQEHPEEPASLAFTAVGADAAAGGQGLAALLRGEKTPSATALLGMKRSGQWLLWKKGLPLAATVARQGNGRALYQSYDPAACECQPPDAAVIQKEAGRWQDRQEELAVLWSALRAFKSAKGSLPGSPADLVKPFPANVLGGVTPRMKEAFPALRAAAAALEGTAPPAASPPPSAAPGSAAPGQGQGSGAETAEGAELPFFREPLRIMVDKQKHRLALASGNIILRNYPVGLGGDKTPEGEFAISDKVVNPNGRDNGEFGSRGMQLSDSNYAIHGTNEPESIGKDESLGCIRMSRKDIEELFAMVPMGTKVTITGKGSLPEELIVPEERYPSDSPRNQTNPHKVYHWLN